MIKVNNKANPTKKDLNNTLRDSDGNEILLHIKNKEGKIEKKKIKPFNEYKKIKVKKKWSINAKYYEMEIDPFIEKLMKDYSLNLNKKTHKNNNS